MNTGLPRVFISSGGDRAALPALIGGDQEPGATPVWKKNPTWYLLAGEDRMINPKTQRFMAERMNATIHSHAVDHTPLLTAPDEVAEIIREAAQATSG